MNWRVVATVKAVIIENAAHVTRLRFFEYDRYFQDGNTLKIQKEDKDLVYTVHMIL
jgi:hypothetical protein